MGVVYRGRRTAPGGGPGDDVAIKVMLSGVGSDVSVERFMREAQLAAQLDHPAIVRVRDAGWEDGRPFMVMDFVRGKSLQELFCDADRRPTPRRVASMMKQVAEAVAFAHARGVIHRDIKPANVFVSDEDDAVLGDFGIAKDLEATRHLTNTGQLLGTPGYMAPEQLDGVRTGPPSDVYSLGTTLYQGLAGRPPFPGTNVVDVVRAIVGKEADRLETLCPDLDPALAELCHRCIEKEPEDRPSAAELAAELGRWLEGGLVGDGVVAGRRRVRAAKITVVGIVLAGLAAAGVAVAIGLTRPTAASSSKTGPPTPEPTPAPDWFGALEPAARPPLPLPASIDFGERPGEYVARKDPTVVLVWVPPGDLRYGEGTDGPLVTVSGFFVGRDEITWRQVRRWRERIIVEAEQELGDSATHLLWHEAVEYARWLGLHLPSDVQWELAARGHAPANGSAGRIYPWGDEPLDQERCVYDLAEEVGPSPPGTRSPAGDSPFGCTDMSGNVCEWTLDTWLDEVDGDADVPPDGSVDPLGPLVRADAPDMPSVGHRGGDYWENAPRKYHRLEATVARIQPLGRTQIGIGMRVSWSRATAARMNAIAEQLPELAARVIRARTPWTRIEVAGEAMPPRTGHAAAFDDRSRTVLVFGGRKGHGAGAVHANELWRCWPHEGRYAKLEVEGDCPEARSRHTMVWDGQRDRLVLFGGVDSAGRALGDLWEYDGTAWHPRATQAAPGAAPEARHSHGMTYDPDTGRVLLFGGATKSAILDDFWAWDGNAGAWKRLEPTTEARPQARAQVGMANDGAGTTWLFGGRTDADGKQRLRELWAWDGEGWRQVLPGPLGDSPSARYGSAMAGGNGAVIAQSGKGVPSTDGSFKVDAWVLRTGRWTHLTPPLPRPRRYPRVHDGAVAVDTSRGDGVAILIGGYDDDTRKVTNDIWTFPLDVIR